MTARIDRTGQVFERLTLLKPDPTDGRKWLCMCACGETVSVFASNVTRGLTKSCGCLSREETSRRFRKEARVRDDPAYKAAYHAAYREKNRDHLLAEKRAYNEANKDAISESKRACYLKRREHYLSRVKANYNADPEATITRERLKATLKKEATPPWADIDAIKELYREARRLTAATGVKYHVDHVVPLRHPLVCGLHVETNMQVITADDNWRKHNRFTAWD